MVNADGVPVDLVSEMARHCRVCSNTTFTGNGVATLKPAKPCGKVLRADALINGSTDGGAGSV